MKKRSLRYNFDVKVTKTKRVTMHIAMTQAGTNQLLVSGTRIPSPSVDRFWCHAECSEAT